MRNGWKEELVIGLAQNGVQEISDQGELIDLRMKSPMVPINSQNCIVSKYSNNLLDLNNISSLHNIVI